MRQQTKPFVVEKKTSRNLKTDNQKTSIWGKLDLTLRQDLAAQRDAPEQTAAAGDIAGRDS
ncbi:hypothetical protein EN745_00490 [Mesorhizobium sp. M4A.F.Ca.ET.022.05.2.1]|uniref:hypothetical protein n=1 Tax=Mesorhizobium sp. M4A.F.Ca.ET.022.05.2.1 TaxID=2496653 RepID=UPI000FCA3DBE|nr:hypothetical protein [Mesorhizobium sp. M4A.F.Ca.ET.022.05.2.1]RVC83916.1 hypothetical protein EN745_00490 [Mesorhizobium sp. M4A.F.Ca.ET.022.05.2.1]